MKSSKADIYSKVHKIPLLKFNRERKLTSYAGIVIFQALFNQVRLKLRLRQCFSHLKNKCIYGQYTIVLLLIVHLILGFRRLRALEYYRHDPMVARVVGLERLPDVATISRSLSCADEKCVSNIRSQIRDMVLQRLAVNNICRLTIDFDGSVQSTKGHAEGTAVGFNKKKKGARSYYPLFATIAQTDQFFDLWHRPGNVHDSNEAVGFMEQCFHQIRELFPAVILESRIDSAFFNQDIFNVLEQYRVLFSCSVPFERFAELKQIVQSRKRWHPIDDEWSYFESDWKPKCWTGKYRLLFLRQRRPKSHKGPLQLDLFQPKDYEYEYKVVATNKTESAKSVLKFHNGRGSQEKLFGEAKQNVALDLVCMKRRISNQIFTLCGMLAHNLSRELQMASHSCNRRNDPKRRTLWQFMSLGTIRQHLIHNAGLLSRPQGELTLTMNTNNAVQSEITRYLEALKEAA